MIIGLKSGAFKNIVVFTGSDIGIPDFKSDEVLSYLQQKFLSEYKLPAPQSLFELDFYKKRPEAFSKFANEFLFPNDESTQLTHKFVKYLNDRDLLSKYFTSNIENTEGKLIPKAKIVHTYGALKDDPRMVSHVYCTKCGKEEQTSQFLLGI